MEDRFDECRGWFYLYGVTATAEHHPHDSIVRHRSTLFIYSYLYYGHGDNVVTKLVAYVPLHFHASIIVP
jgi:hypothetical protein